MLFRTKLFLASSSIVLLLWAGAWWPIQHLISANFDKMTTDNFTATRQSLHSLQVEQVNRMRQAAGMVMNIPELRSLIAESQVEITTDNLASLQDRLDSLVTVVDSKFICVLDGRRSLIAQNSSSPWHGMGELKNYLSRSPQASSLINKLFSKPTDGVGKRDGLWIYQGQLYQVVGLPLIFSSDAGEAWHPDGALIMASPVTTDLATNLGRSHDCDISFLSPYTVLASSLSAASQAIALRVYDQQHLPLSQSFDIALGDTNYSSYLEPLTDPCSNTVVGATLIQDSQADTAAVQRKISLSLLAIMSSGLFSAACISFLVSGAITRPVRELVKAVGRVAAGDMESSIDLGRRDEIGQLANAFNDMVVQLRTRHELQRQVDESQAATKAKSQFLANMSHEIRTPLNGVIGVANLLLLTPLDDRQRHYAELVRSSTEVLTTLINDILDFSKIEAGKLDLEMLEFDLRTVVEDVVELLSLKASDKGVAMSTQFDVGVPHRTIGDPNRLRQVLMNLIGNAVKFTDAGEIVVRISIDGPLLRFAVIDTGPGIPPDRMERLFKSFSQVDASTTRRYGGTGLGLAISKQLAELMGGSIGVDSQLGRGSTFWFTANLTSADSQQPLPAVEKTLAGGLILPPNQSLEPNLHSTAGRSARILLAEDNQINQIVAADLLTNSGHQVETVGDGRSAVERVKIGSFDLVLMDCQMPVMDGLEATREIRQIEQENVAGRRIPIIALTANASGVDRSRCVEAGMDGYCPKPFRPAELLAIIAKFLGHADADAPAQLKTAEVDNHVLSLDVLLESCTQSSGLAVKILEKFEKQVTEAAQQFKTCFEQNNAAELARLSHSLKGTAGIVGADNLRKKLAEMEILGRSESLISADKQLAELQQEIDRVASFIPRAILQLQTEIGKI